MSHRPGSTLIPSVEITSAPAGIAHLAHPADGLDALPLDQHDAVLERRAAVAVDQPAADQGLDGGGCSGYGNQEERMKPRMARLMSRSFGKAI